jgi:type IV secretion system T-DNA border endonuclease VirD1
MNDSAEPFLLPDLISAPSQSAPSHRREQRADADGYKIVSVRLREAEFEGFSEQARSLGLTNNMALRIAARRIGGFLEIDNKTRLKLEEGVDAIGEISQQIARLHGLYKRIGQVDMEELAAQRAAFGREFAQLDAQLRIILNVSRRRVDGRVRLQDAMAS